MAYRPHFVHRHGHPRAQARSPSGHTRNHEGRDAHIRASTQWKSSTKPSMARNLQFFVVMVIPVRTWTRGLQVLVTAVLACTVHAIQVARPQVRQAGRQLAGLGGKRSRMGAIVRLQRARSSSACATQLTHDHEHDNLTENYSRHFEDSDHPDHPVTF